MTMLRVNLDQFKDLVTSLSDSCQSLDEFVKYANKANGAFISGNEGSWEEDEGSRFILLQNAYLALSDGLGDYSKDCEKASDDLSGNVRGKRDAVLAGLSGKVRTQRSKVEEGRRACVDDFQGTYVGRFSRSLVTCNMLEKARVNVIQVIVDKVKMYWGMTEGVKKSSKAAATAFSSLVKFLTGEGYENWESMLLATANNKNTVNYWKLFLSKINPKDDIRSKFSWHHTDLSTGKEDGWNTVIGKRSKKTWGQHVAPGANTHGGSVSFDLLDARKTGAVPGRPAVGFSKQSASLVMQWRSGVRTRR